MGRDIGWTVHLGVFAALFQQRISQLYVEMIPNTGNGFPIRWDPGLLTLKCKQVLVGGMFCKLLSVPNCPLGRKHEQ
jgi:hypothetical protein